MEQPAGDSKCNLIINYLPQTLTDEEFRSMFNSVGPVRLSKIVRDRATNYSYGFGFVEFIKPEDAARAVEALNGLQLQNKTIKVAYSREGDNIKGANLYVRGLPRTITEEAFRDLFTKYGHIIQSRLLYHPTTKLCKGVGFVLFNAKDEADVAIAELDGTKIDGHDEMLSVKYAEDNKNKQAKYQAGMYQPNPNIQAIHPVHSRGGYANYGRGGPMRNQGQRIRYNPMAGTFQSSNYQPNTYFGQQGYSQQYDQGDYQQQADYQQPGNSQGEGFILFVYNIGPAADEGAIWQLFSPFGTVSKVNVIRDFQKNLGKGYGFVTMIDYNEAWNAIQGLNGYQFTGGKPLQVSFKMPNMR